ncbi:hypothetical protein ASF79_16350 [Agreia sp. Leaf335]|uniref:hypothetical protein n=1 Tax=Agreia sp. Leaf335 TaxID=1736340 RepID=UPI0006F47892|nr:hypothetical protein [Agreia sp. Leaf335]KQR19224.1 hypothetical protein ASF79_16350 [Agreia sp. Leaf335]
MDVHVQKRRISSTQVTLAWCASLLLLVGVFATGVLALNLSVFSSSGFVTTYLQTLGARDVDGALAMPGVELPSDLTPDSAGAALLKRNTLGTISKIRVTDDSDLGSGIHRVTVSYTLDGAGRQSARTQSEFVVERDGTNFGIFTQWRFKETPVATLSLAVTNATSVSVGSGELKASDLGAGAGAFGAGGRFSVLVPSLVVLSHESHYLTSDTVAVPVTSPGDTENAVVKAVPNELFTQAVSDRLTSFLDDCAAQKVLYPVGCPFSKGITDRIEGEPTWSIVTYPQVSVVAGPSSWLLADNTGTAHIDVQVKSLFDGTVSALSEDVPFSLNYAISLDDAGQISFAARSANLAQLK